MIGETNSILEINDKIPEYTQIINYIMLYDGSLGDATLNECQDITGGWTSTYYYNNTSCFWNKKTDCLEAGMTQRRAGSANWRTTNKLDFSSYAYIGLIAKSTNVDPFVPRLTTAASGYSTIGTQNVGFYCNVARQNNVKHTYLLNIKESTFGYLNNSYLATYQNGDGAAFTYNVYASAVFNSDNWTTLASIAGITVDSIDTLLANSNIILSNKAAVAYMVYNCTGDFMINAIANETFLNALNNSEYATLVYANEHWSKFLGFIS